MTATCLYSTDTSFARTSILDLPSELLEDIFRQVSRRSLKHLSLTCQRFYPIASSRIWHTIEIKDKCSQRRHPKLHRYNPDGAPEQDPDGDILAGMPLRWGHDALQAENPRRARPLPVAADPTNPNPTPVDLDRNPLDPGEIADQHRRERDHRYSMLDPCSNGIGLDQHDDLPAIRKLYLLASRPDLAYHVRVVWHRCHLVTPDMSTELVWISCDGQTLSSDWRTLNLLRLAIRNMVNVTTLKFAMPHWNIYWTMICDFMDSSRKRNNPVSKLWLETCSAIRDANLWPSRCDFSTIESIRFRRLKISEDSRAVRLSTTEVYPSFFLSRTGPPVRIRNGYGGMYFTSTHTIAQEEGCRPLIEGSLTKVTPDAACNVRCQAAQAFDDLIYAQIPEVPALLAQMQDTINSLPSLSDDSHDLDTPSRYHKGRRMIRWLRHQFNNLTHLNLDWLILRKPQRSHEFTMSSLASSTAEKLMFADLSKLRIKTLRSFQLRNALSLNSILPPDIFLLTPTEFINDATGDDVHSIDFLGFLEAHPHLICLAWPMDAFIRDELWREGAPATQQQMTLAQHVSRVDVVIQRLGIMLQTLRVDVMFRYRGEPHTEIMNVNDMQQQASCYRRRLFITTVASQLQRVRILKIEGYVPRDEKREILRAMKSCPLEHFVSIGRTFPLGNTWGLDAEELEEFEGEAWSNSFIDNFEPEAMSSFGSIETLPTPRSSRVDPSYRSTVDSISRETTYMINNDPGDFIPRWGWSPLEPPLLCSIAYFHADTITELKFCGSSSAIVYGSLHISATNITELILAHLKYFHGLRSLIISHYSSRDTRFSEEDVILTWLCERDALWHGKDETFLDDAPNAETDKVIWHDLGLENGNADPTDESSLVDEEELVKVIEKFKDVPVVQQALRRAYIWSKHWSIHSSVTPFPCFPDFGYVDEGDSWELSGLISFGAVNASGMVRTSHGAHFRDLLDRSKMIVLKNVRPFAIDQAPPLPGDVFAPFSRSHYFMQWFNSPFLIAPTEPDQISFFWRHLAASMQLLRYRFSPIRMSERICEEMSQFLSPVALSTSPGVKVRASFCMGAESNDIFDLDVLMDQNGVKRFWGPRPEADWGRWREKNDARQYF